MVLKIIHRTSEQMSETEKLKSFIKNLGIDVVGIADLKPLKGMPSGIPTAGEGFLKHYRCAIVMGAQVGKLGKKASGDEVSKFLENAAADVTSYLEKRRYYALPIHTEDELDPIKRWGLLSLKVLARGAGLGWQGRSLLIVSKEYGPLHRLVAVLTDMALQPDPPQQNQCGDCSVCVDQCPTRALTWVKFDHHPQQREEVLDIRKCLGDDGCMVCIHRCPWPKI